MNRRDFLKVSSVAGTGLIVGLPLATGATPQTTSNQQPATTLGPFIQITSDDAQDLPIPGEPYTFGVLKAAQALGDFVYLGKRNRRAIRVHLGADVDAGLKKLQAAMEKALG